MTPRVLYIDDEEHNLQSFKAAFRRQYDIFLATSATAARTILEENEIHVIISDQRMPDVTGVDFFKTIKDIYPHPLRILLTGYTDIEVLANAINEGHIYRYHTKPWNELELVNSITNAYEAYQNRKLLRQNVEKLQKTNDQLNRFIYSISHELRAPLASALGVLELAKLEGLMNKDALTAEYWSMMKECCEQLDKQITKTLQYYRNSRYKIVQEKIDFKKLINTLIALHKSAHKISSEINVILHVSQPADFWGDAFRIETVIGNLISNAIKYQNPDEPDKKIEINATVQPDAATVTVADNGLGIAQADHGNIFTQFFRGRHNDGAGLGLFIVKEALERINGNISVTSAEGKGSVFSVIFPNMKLNT